MIKGIIIHNIVKHLYYTVNHRSACTSNVSIRNSLYIDYLRSNHHYLCERSYFVCILTTGATQLSLVLVLQTLEYMYVCLAFHDIIT